ncbi:MAG TPA: DUF4252 domain-containing protein [Bacteroidales bacterium]|nr:DUF4252 domain-containing protein [Bacteroidales bacterium]
MKKIIGIIAAALVTLSVNGQKSIDDLFARYAGKDGFTTVTINGNLLKLAKLFDNEDSDRSEMPANISVIRILSQEDGNDGKVENFYDAVIKDIDLTKYDEFMQVKEKDQQLKMLVRTEGKKFTEFLLISGGRDNAIIQIKGSMSFEEARKFADDTKKDHGSNLIKH